MSPIWITICAVLLTLALCSLTLAGAVYWLAQAEAVRRGIYDEPKQKVDDDDGDAWKRGRSK